MEAKHGLGVPYECPVVLFDEVVEVFDLADLNQNILVFNDPVDCQFVGAAFVHRDFLREHWPASRSQGPQGCLLVPLGSQQKVYGLACLVYSAVQIFPFDGDFDVGLIQPSAHTPWRLAPAKTDRQHWQISNNQR
jgi:hypothetical protein